jgi:hypothetical protein
MKRFNSTYLIKHFFFLPVLLICVSVDAQELNFKWERRTGFSNGSRWGTKNNVWIGPDGNIIHAGRDAIAKFTPGGNKLWERPIDLPANYAHSGLSLGVDEAGNSYVTAVDPNKAPGDATLMSDIYLIKISPTGETLWDRWYNGTANLADVAAGIAIDQSANVYITSTSEVSAGVFRIVTLKYNSAGTLLWTKTFPGGVGSHANAIAVDYYTGDVYVAGATIIDNNGLDFTTIKINTNGTQVWAKTYNGVSPDSEHDEALAITVDLDGNVLVAGFSTQTYENDNGIDKDVEVYTTFKYDRTNGNQLWKKTFGKDQPEGAGFMTARATAIAADRSGNAVVTGYVTDPADGRYKMATLKYNKTDGHSAWTRIFQPFDYVPVDENDKDIIQPTTIGTDFYGNVYMGGWYKTAGHGYDWMMMKLKGADGHTEGFWAHFGDYMTDDRIADFAVHPNGDVYASGINYDRMSLIKVAICTITFYGDTKVNNDPGECGAIVEYTSIFRTGTCGTTEYSIPNKSFFPVGTTRVIATSPVNGDTASFNVIVKDTEIPKITSSPAAVTVNCAGLVPAVNTASVTATDNCNVVVTHVSDVITNQTCANKYTIKRTYKAEDPSGNTAFCEQLITVDDNVAPQINGLSLSQYSLWAPDHRMRDITVNYDIVDNCISSPNVTINITSNEPVNGTADGDTDPDWQVIDLHHIKLRAERASNGNGRIYTITITVNDGCNPPVTQSKEVFVAHNIKDPITGLPFKVGSTVAFSGVFWDKAGNTHTAKWLVDGSAVTNGVVTEPAGAQNGKVTGAYKFNTPGVYKLQMNVTDQTGVTSYANTNNDMDAIVVIYDPNGGNAYGGGWFTSPVGALKSNPAATGNASYGFAVNYANANKPKGETQFEFKVGSFEFNALNFDYLSIGGAKAQFRGTGKIIGGQSGIGFIMTVKDGALDGSGLDKIRMKIFNRSTGQVYYDNQPGASDAEDPVTVVGNNSVVVIQGSQVINTSAPVTSVAGQEVMESEKEVMTSDKLQLVVYPNPSNHAFSVQVKTGDFMTKMQMQVYDQNGKMIERRENLSPGSILKFGEKYRPGVYYLRLMQGKKHSEVQVVKVDG